MDRESASSVAPTLNVSGRTGLAASSSPSPTSYHDPERPRQKSKKLHRPSTAPSKNVTPLLPSSRNVPVTLDTNEVFENLPSTLTTNLPTASHATEYDWATFIGAYAMGKWDPNRTPDRPASSTNMTAYPTSQPDGFTNSHVRAQSSSGGRDFNESPSHDASPSNKSISRSAAPSSLTLPSFTSHRLRNSFSSSIPSSSGSLDPEPAVSPVAGAERQAAAAALRWAGARNPLLSPLALPSPEHELTDPMRGVTSSIPGSRSVTSETNSSSRWSRFNNFWQGTQDIEPTKLSTIEGSPSGTPLPTPPLPHPSDGISYGPPQLPAIPFATAPVNPLHNEKSDSAIDLTDYFGSLQSSPSPVTASDPSSSDNDDLAFAPSPSSATLEDSTSPMGTLSVPAVPRRICLTRQSSSPLPTTLMNREETLPGGRMVSESLSHVKAGRSQKEEQMFLDLGYLAPPNPPEELERRRAMYKFNIWNTGPDSNFDRIAHLAKLVFNTKGVIISIMDGNEQWYKSSSGYQGPAITERVKSFCAHSILQCGDEPMIVLDTHRDWRFEKHPMVAGSPNIRFYAGAPLRTHDGYNIGCLAVFHDEPMEDFNPRQRHTLKEFAAIAMREMELWRDKIQLRIRDRIQISMEEFSRECLEVDHTSTKPGQQSVDVGTSTMDKIYDRAANLVRTTLDVEGVLVMDILQADLADQPGKELNGTVILHHGNQEAITRLVDSAEYASLMDFFTKYPEGKISEGIVPMCFRSFLPRHIQYALTVPIFNVDKRPFAMLCAYNTPNHEKRYLEGHELSYLRAIGVIILSAVLKRRMILADKAKGLFISNISHELRTPLHGILAAAELLSDTPMNAVQQSFLHTVQACGTSLVETVNHVLDFTKLSGSTKVGNVESGVVVAEVNLLEMIEEAVDGCWMGYHARQASSDGTSGIGSVYAPPQTEDGSATRRLVEAVVDIQLRPGGWRLKCEKGGIRRVFMNVFGNALKFTSDGFVHVVLKQAPNQPEQPPNTIRVELAVIDTGKGINQHFLKNQLFHPFSQENPLQTGTGLGLAIVNSIVKAMNGSIEVLSEEGTGTEVKVQFNAEIMDNTASDLEPSIRPEQGKQFKIALLGFDATHIGSRLLYTCLVGYLEGWWGFQVVQVDELERAQIVVLNNSVEEVKRATRDHDLSRPFLVLVASRSDRYFLEASMEHENMGGFCRILHKPLGPSTLRAVLAMCSHAIKIGTRSVSATPPPDQTLDSSTSVPAIIPRRNSEKLQAESASSGDASGRSERPLLPRSITAPPAASWLATLSTQDEETRPIQDELDPDTKVPAITIGKDGALLKSSVADSALHTQEDQVRVLVIEDNVVLRNLLLKWLKTKGFIFREAFDGRHGVTTFEADGPFDIVLLDLSMPILDGVEATAEIRQIEKARNETKPSRILALTGMSSLEDKTRAFDAGVDGYLVKPVPFKMLEDIFRKLGLIS